MAADASLQRQFEASGVRALPTARALSCLDRAFELTDTHLIAIDANWETLVRRGGHHVGELLRDLVRPSAERLRDSTNLTELLANVDGEERAELLAKFVTSMLRNELGLDANQSIDPNVAFEELGLESISSVSLRNRLSSELDLFLPSNLLSEQRTLSELVAHLSAQLLEKTPTRTPAKTAAAGIVTLASPRPLVCFHPAEGDVAVYGQLSQLLQDRRIIGLEARVVDGRLPRETVEELVDDFVDLITQSEKKGPIDLLGHSFGGTVAHAVGAQLEAQGWHVCSVWSIDSPTFIDQDEIDPVSATAILMGGVAIDAARRLSADELALFRAPFLDGARGAVDALYQNISQRCPGQRFRPLDDVTRLHHMLIGHLELLARYRNVPQLQAQRFVVFAENGAPWRHCDWGTFCRGAFRKLCLPGNHQTVMTTDNIRPLCELLQ